MPSKRCPPAPGDHFGVGTDGIWEARDPRSASSERNVSGTLSGGAARSAQDMVTAVFDEVGRFCGPAYHDDVTLVVIKIQ